MNILLVDDNTENRGLLRLTLESEEHHVLQAANGAEALSILRRHSVDAIVSDVLMPIMNGYQLCTALRKTKRFKNIPFVFYSGNYGTAGGERLGDMSGGDKFVRKPASTFSVLAALYEAVRDKKDMEVPESSAAATSGNSVRKARKKTRSPRGRATSGRTKATQKKPILPTARRNR
jgi:CheY-like chemotaxis protein